MIKKALLITKYLALAGLLSVLSVPSHSIPPSKRQLAKSDSFPYSAVVSITSYYENELSSFCTGVLIGKDKALTARHCVSKLTGYPYNDIVVVGRSSRVISVAKVTKIKMPSSQASKEVKGLEDDWAILSLSSEMGLSLGYFDQLNRPSTENSLFLVGFMESEIGGIIRQESRNCSTRQVVGAKTLFSHNCDMLKGFSGAPIFQETEEGVRLVGINIGSIDTPHKKTNLSIKPLLK